MKKINWVFKSRYRFLSCVFIALLIIPAVTYPVLKNVLSAERDGLNENRNLSKFEFSFLNFGANFDAYYQDNFPFRNSLIPLYNKYYNKFFGKHSAENPGELDVIEEFILTEPDIIEESVKNDFKEEEASEFTGFLNMLVDADNYFKSLNKKIIFQVCPRKNYITSRTTGINRLDSLSSYIDRNSNVSFSYPKNKYLAIEPDYMSYDEYNGHHNFLGAYVSWQEIQSKAGIAQTDISGISITEYEIDVRKIVTTPYNITCCYPYNQDLPAVRKTEHIISINYNVEYKPDIEIETLHNSGCKQLEFKSNNSNGRTLFMTGDSFLETQIQYAIKDFEFSSISHLYNFDAGGKDQTYRSRIKKYIESADVIVIVIGENNLWSNNLEHNPGLEHRLALILELAKEIYG